MGIEFRSIRKHFCYLNFSALLNGDMIKLLPFNSLSILPQTRYRSFPLSSVCIGAQTATIANVDAGIRRSIAHGTSIAYRPGMSNAITRAIRAMEARRRADAVRVADLLAAWDAQRATTYQRGDGIPRRPTTTEDTMNTAKRSYDYAESFLNTNGERGEAGLRAHLANGGSLDERDRSGMNAMDIALDTDHHDRQMRLVAPHLVALLKTLTVPS